MHLIYHTANKHDLISCISGHKFLLIASFSSLLGLKGFKLLIVLRHSSEKNKFLEKKRQNIEEVQLDSRLLCKCVETKGRLCQGRNEVYMAFLKFNFLKFIFLIE